MTLRPPLLSHPRYRVADLFCGCGGLTRGLELTGRFQAVLGIDIHKSSVETFVANHGTPEERPAAILSDIRDVQLDDLWKHLAKYGIHEPGDLECLVGGPPCEGFSRNKVYLNHAEGAKKVAPIKYEEEKYWKTAWKGLSNQSKSKLKSKTLRAYNPFLDDPRNLLFRSFLDITAELLPKIVVIENVQQMLQHASGAMAKEVFERLRALDYRTECRILNAADFGVPQIRKRVFFLAVRNDVLIPDTLLPWPKQTHSALEASDAAGGFPGDHGAYVTVREAIADLPLQRPERQPDKKMSSEPTEYPSVLLSEFRRFARSNGGIPLNNFYRTPSAEVIAKLRAMRPGMKAHHLPKKLQTKKYYYNAYARLEWDKPSNTITKSFIYPGSGKFGHPDEDRVISYREAARLQSFDDAFRFIGSSQEAISHMIGSAVPPRLGCAFGQALATALDELQKRQKGELPQHSRMLAQR